MSRVTPVSMSVITEHLYSEPMTVAVNIMYYLKLKQPHCKPRLINEEILKGLEDGLKLFRKVIQS